MNATESLIFKPCWTKKCESMFSDQRKSLCVLPQWPIAWPLLVVLLVVESRNIMMLGRPSAYRQQFAPDSYYHLSPAAAVTEQYKFGCSWQKVGRSSPAMSMFAFPQVLLDISFYTPSVIPRNFHLHDGPCHPSPAGYDQVLPQGYIMIHGVILLLLV